MLLVILISVLLAGWFLYNSETLLILQDIASADKPSRYKRRTAIPQLTSLAYCYKDKEHMADLYLGNGHVGAAIVLVAGAAEGGKNDPRLMAFAQTLARAGFAVMVPVLEDVQRMRLRAENAQEIVSAFEQLQQRFADGRLPVGLAAFSYASGPTLLAAMSAEIAEKVDFVISIGAYYDIDTVLAYITTGYATVVDSERAITPRPFTRLLFVLSHVDLLPAQDGEIINAAIEQYRSCPEELELTPIREQLGMEGRAMLDFIANKDRKQVAILYQRLPAAIRNNLQELDLVNKDMSRLKAKLILIHGRSDDMIPYQQSLLLAQAVNKAQAYIVNGLQHVDLKTTLRDGWVLYRAMRTILRLRLPR